MYIPLYDLAQYHGDRRDCIDAYLRSTFPDDERAAINRLSYTPWDCGPSLILLLDGHNEVPVDARDDVDKGIRKWAWRSGTQVVTTSRIPSLTCVTNTWHVDLKGLGEDDVRSYLAKCNADLPDDSSSLWQVLETPLMLRLYVDAEAFKETMNVPYVSLEEPDSAGHLVWNYLQRELWRVVNWNRGDFSKAEYAAALLLTLPYVCWRMEAAHEFRVGRERLTTYVRKACQRWHGKRRPQGFGLVEIELLSYYDAMDINQVSSSQIAIMSNETGLLSWNGDGYTLLHQSLRDGLAAIHLKNVMEAPTDDLPCEFKKSISENVKDFLVDLSDNNRLLELWESNRNELPTKTIPTNNLLRLIHAKLRGDLRVLDWSGMDLRVTNLFPFKQGRKLNLSSDKNRFKGTAVDVGLFRPFGHSNAVTSLCFSPDGTLLASISTDKSVQIWDSSSGLPACRSPQGVGARHICFSPKGDLLATACDDGTISILHVSSGCLVGTPTQNFGARHVCFSPDGVLLATACDDGAIRFLLSENSGFSVRATCRGIDATTICFSPDGESLTGACGDGKVYLLRQVREGDWQPVKASEDNKWWTRLAFFAHDACIASILSTDDPPFYPYETVESTWLGFFDVESLELKGKPLRLEACYDYDTVCCFCAEKSLVALCSVDQGDSEIRLLDVASGQSAVIGNWTNVTCMSFSHDGSLLAIGNDDGSIDVYDIRDSTAERLRSNVSRKGPGFGYLRMSADGKLLAVIEDIQVNHRTCRLISVREGVLAHGPLFGLVKSGDVVGIAPDGTMIAVIAGDGSVRVSDLSNGTAATITLDSNRGNAAKTLFSPDGSMLVVFYDDGAVRFWNPTEGSESFVRLEGCRDQRRLSCFSPEGSVFATVLDNGVVSLTDIRLSSRYEVGFGAEATAMRFSPDGSQLACGYDKEALTLWEIASLQGLTQENRANLVGFLRHDEFLCGKINSICFSEDGSVLACGSSQGHVYICDLDHDAPARTATVKGAVCSLRFSPDKTTLAVEYAMVVKWGDLTTICLIGVGDGALIGDAINVPYSDGLACAHYTSDGSIFTVVGLDGMMHCWNRASGWEAFPIITEADPLLFYAASSEDGSTHAVISIDGGTVWLMDRDRFSKENDGFSSHVRRIELLSDIDIYGVDLSLASIESEHDLEVLRQNGAIVPQETVEYAVPVVVDESKGMKDCVSDSASNYH